VKSVGSGKIHIRGISRRAALGQSPGAVFHYVSGDATATGAAKKGDRNEWRQEKASLFDFLGVFLFIFGVFFTLGQAGFL
jgi:hypothetical protein